MEFEPDLRFNATFLALFARRYLPGHQLTVCYQPGNPERASVNRAVIS